MLASIAHYVDTEPTSFVLPGYVALFLADNPQILSISKRVQEAQMSSPVNGPETHSLIEQANARRTLLID